EVELTYDWLRHGKQLTERMPRSEAPVVAEQIARRIASALEAERRGEFPARPGPGCRWCGYRDACESSPFRADARPGDGCPRCGSPLRWRAGSRGEIVTCEK